MNIDRGRASPFQAVPLDGNNKKYMAAIDRVLITFEQIESWPDNIAFLNRLLKTVQCFPTIPLPRKREISACLALCVVAQLPAGVQQKAFEVYSYIFSSLQDLSDDLSIFLVGLTPVLGYASTTVKTNYIALVSTFLIPLKEKLRTCSTSLILSILPGLEDEQDDSFKSCLNLMDELRFSLGSNNYFWDSFWYASISVTGTQRGGTLAYLAHHLSQETSHRQVSSDTGLLQTCIGGSTVGFASAFTAGLRDENHLVQRGFLELLVSHGKLSMLPIKDLSKKEKGNLLYAASQIVLKRDVGLNRRLWLWLTEMNAGDKLQSTFSKYAAEDLVEAILDAMEVEFPKTNKIILSLLDRDDIGGEIIVAILPKLIRLTIVFQDESQYPDILLSTRAILDAIAFETIFEYMLASCKVREFGTAHFLLDNCGLHDTEQFTSTASQLFLDVLLASPDTTSALLFANSLSKLFTGSALEQEICPTALLDMSLDLNEEECHRESLLEGEVEEHPQTFGYLWPKACFQLLLGSAQDINILYRIVNRRLDLGEVGSDVITLTIGFITELIRRYSAQTLPFDHIQGVIPLLVRMAERCETRAKACHQDLCKKVAQQCWHYLGSSKLKYEITSVSLFSSLAGVVSAADFEAFFAELVAYELESACPIEKFAALWTHYAKLSDRALLRTSSLLVLDSLAFGSRLQQSFILRWMHGSAPTMSYLLRFVLGPIYQFIPLHSAEHEELSVKCLLKNRPADFDLGRATYLMSLLSRCLERIGERSLNLFQDLFSCDDLMDDWTQMSALSPKATILDVFCEAGICALQIDLVDDIGARTFYEHCIDIVAFVDKISGMTSTKLEESLMHKLVLAISRKQHVLQQVFLEKMLALRSNPLEHTGSVRTLSSILISGIAESRQHPVLQDFLNYCASRIDLKDKSNSEVVLDLTHCVIEQVDLNLIDIDAVLNIKSAQETTTAHENVMLLLDLLQTFGNALLQEGEEDDTNEASVHQSNGFLQGVLFKTTNTDVERTTQGSTGLSLPLSSIIVAGCNVWLWGSRNSESTSLATTYISEMFSSKSYQLMSKLSSYGAASDTLQVLLNQWYNSTIDNRIQIQALCHDLFGQDQIGRLCKVIKASLSFNQSREKRSKDSQPYKNMLYTSVILQTASDIDVVAAVTDITAVMRHFLLHIPTSIAFDSTILDLATMFTAKTLKANNENSKKLKRELCDILIRIYAVVVSEHSVSESGCPLASVLIQHLSRIPDTMQDDEKATILLSSVFVNVIQPGLRNKSHDPLPLMLCQELVALTRFRKIWRREVHDLFHDSSFFDIPSSMGSLWIPIVRSWISGEKDGFAEIVNKPSYNAPSHLFTSLDSDRIQKTLFLKRITFLQLSLSHNAMVDKLSAIVDRIEDTAYETETSSTHIAGLILIQTILLKTSPIHIRNHLVHLVLLLQRSFNRLIEATDPLGIDANLLYTTLRTLDVMLYLGNEEFQLHIWLFVDHMVENDRRLDSKNDNSLTARLCRKMGDDYLGVQFSSLMRTSDALEMHVGDYLHNVSLLYRDWNLSSSKRSRDFGRIEAEIVAQLFDK